MELTSFESSALRQQASGRARKKKEATGEVKVARKSDSRLVVHAPPSVLGPARPVCSSGRFAWAPSARLAAGRAGGLLLLAATIVSVHHSLAPTQRKSQVHLGPTCPASAFRAAS